MYYVKSGDDFVEFDGLVEAITYAENLSIECECICEVGAVIVSYNNGRVNRTQFGDIITKWMVENEGRNGRLL